MAYAFLLLVILFLAGLLWFCWWLFKQACKTSTELSAKVEDLEQANELLKKENAQFYKFGVAQRFNRDTDWPEEIH